MQLGRPQVIGEKSVVLKKRHKLFKTNLPLDIKQQGTDALLAATFKFLRQNEIRPSEITKYAKMYSSKGGRSARRLHVYTDLLRKYEEMGVIMATWFSHPRFLDNLGQPIALRRGNGEGSIGCLLRTSGSHLQPASAIQLMRQSPSIKACPNGTLIALRRVFILPNLEIPRAAFVIERFLETLQQNKSGQKQKSAPLLERSCHVSEVDLATIAPILRDIKDRGTAFMDSIDGDLEVRRIKRPQRKNTGELGVLAFAWVRPNRFPRDVKKIKSKPRRESPDALRRQVPG